MKILFSVITWMIAIGNYAQNSYKGIILNENSQPISGANIISIENPSRAVISDVDGRFEILLHANSQVSISHLGYKTIRVIFVKDFNAVTLEDNVLILNEIIISANREGQSRSEIPAAVSTISSSTIKDTKAIGLKQLVGQVSGVFMSSSSVASNEQHMMAVRSPITTKALFLYLEDGLPIRPSAIFNHNALLETNQTSFQKIEILKGPSSSIYGSDAIGGSFNFITKNPTRNFNSSLGFEINDLGLTRYTLNMSKYINDNFGFYLGSHFVERNDGPIEHSDYDKFALTFKTVHNVNPSIKWTNVFDVINYLSDTTGELSTDDYKNGNYESDQTFTNRKARSLRFNSTLSKRWSSKNKTTASFVFRDNKLNQIPFYRIKQNRNNGQLSGNGSGEINSDQFTSLVGLIQHKLNSDFKNSSLILGVFADYTQQDYAAKPTTVVVNTQTGQNTSYETNENEFILNYGANIFNYAAYMQYEISPIKALKITTALRFDTFKYNYDNLIEHIAGARDTKSIYQHYAPKFGFNYNLSNSLGFYASYSNGFTPPQASDLYRNNFIETGDRVFDLKPSTYHNFELGGYYHPNEDLQLTFSLYYLKGKNTLVSLRDENDSFYNTNIGSTRSLGIEYSFKYQLFSELSIAHNGSFASHRYINFFNEGIDYSHSNMITAPKLLGQSQINYTPKRFKRLSIGLEHELVGSYNSSFENQAINDDGMAYTETYKGHSIFNLHAVYSSSKIEIWGHLLNILDSLYATRVSYNVFRKENTYVIGGPLAVHFGIKYHF